MKLLQKIVALGLSLIMLVMTLSGCSQNQNLLASIQSSGKLVMYTNAAFPPYEFLGQNGEFVGIDVEIGKAIAEKLGVTLEVQNANFDGIISAIASGKGDLAISGITITDERAQHVDFSEPYFKGAQSLVIPENSDIRTLEDLSSKVVGAQTGSTGYLYIEDENNSGLLSEQPCDLRAYQTPTDAMMALCDGKLDAVVVDDVVADQLVNNQAGMISIPLVAADGTRAEESYAIAIAKGNEDLLAIVNEVLEEMESEGLIDQYFTEYSNLISETNGN